MVRLLIPLFPLAQQAIPSEEVIESLFKEISVGVIFHAALTLLITYGLLLGIRSATKAISEQVPRRFRLVIKQSVPFLRGLLVTFAISYLLGLLLNLAGQNLLALTGTIALALGFAFKDYVSAIMAGVVSLFEGPFRMGDRIQIGDHYGEVVDYGFRTLRLRTPDDNTVAIPHSVVWADPISNANSGQLEAQVATHFYFAHDADITQAVGILYQAAYSSRYTQLKLPVVVVSEDPWATHLKLKAYPIDARDEFVYQTDLVLRIKQACARHHLPYPRGPARQDASTQP